MISIINWIKAYLTKNSHKYSFARSNLHIHFANIKNEFVEFKYNLHIQSTTRFQNEKKNLEGNYS